MFFWGKRSGSDAHSHFHLVTMSIMRGVLPPLDIRILMWYLIKHKDFTICYKLLRTQTKELRPIWGAQSDDYAGCYLVGYDAVRLGIQLPWFRRNLIGIYLLDNGESGCRRHNSTLKMEATPSSETLVHLRQGLWRHSAQTEVLSQISYTSLMFFLRQTVNIYCNTGLCPKSVCWSPMVAWLWLERGEWPAFLLGNHSSTWTWYLGDRW
jgi:hypothetical protein